MSKIKSLQDFNDACSERDLDDIQITKVVIFYGSLVSAMELTDHLSEYCRFVGILTSCFMMPWRLQCLHIGW